MNKPKKKESNDTIGNRIRDLPTCSAVPQPTALPRDPAAPRTIAISQVYFSTANRISPKFFYSFGLKRESTNDLLLFREENVSGEFTGISR